MIDPHEEDRIRKLEEGIAITGRLVSRLEALAGQLAQDVRIVRNAPYPLPVDNDCECQDDTLSDQAIEIDIADVANLEDGMDMTGFAANVTFTYFDDADTIIDREQWVRSYISPPELHYPLTDAAWISDCFELAGEVATEFEGMTFAGRWAIWCAHAYGDGGPTPECRYWLWLAVQQTTCAGAAEPFGSDFPNYPDASAIDGIALACEIDADFGSVDWGIDIATLTPLTGLTYFPFTLGNPEIAVTGTP